MASVGILTIGPPPSASERVLGFALGVLVGGVALFLSSRYLADARGYDHAVLTAIIGTLIWSLLSPIPLLGPVVALIGWITVLKWRYSVGWIRAGTLGATAWVTAVIVIALLEIVGIRAVTAIGVPGA